MFGRLRIPMFGKVKLENMEIPKIARKTNIGKFGKKKMLDKNGPYLWSTKIWNIRAIDLCKSYMRHHIRLVR